MTTEMYVRYSGVCQLPKWSFHTDVLNFLILENMLSIWENMELDLWPIHSLLDVIVKVRSVISMPVSIYEMEIHMKSRMQFVFMKKIRAFFINIQITEQIIPW